MPTPDFGAIIRRSWELTWKNKWLWVYGLVISALTGSGFSNYSSGGGSSSSSTKSSTQNLPSDFPDLSFIQTWLSQIPAGTWIILVLSILALLALGLIIRWVTLAWAQGSLIGGINDADHEKEITLGNTTRHGFKSLKNLIIYGLITTVILVSTIITQLLVGVLLYKLIGLAPTIIFGVVSTILTLIIFVALAMINIYSQRLIVLENFSPWEAFKTGLILNRGNVFNTILMGLINFAVNLISLALALFTLFSPAGILILIIFAPILHGILIVFNYANWHQLFKKVYES